MSVVYVVECSLAHDLAGARWRGRRGVRFGRGSGRWVRVRWARSRRRRVCRLALRVAIVLLSGTALSVEDPLASVGACGYLREDMSEDGGGIVLAYQCQRS